MSNAGRPSRYKTPEDMEEAIDTYFESCVPILKRNNEGTAIVNKAGFPVYDLNPPTITGLAIHLGYESRQSIYDNEKKNDEFSYIIKRARLRCENYLEKHGLTGDIPAAMAIFVLKNYGWTDKQEVEHSGGLNVIRLPVKKTMGAPIDLKSEIDG